MEDPEPRIIDEPSVVFDRLSSAGRSTEISPIVTLHELRHRVPGKAAKEYERAVTAKDKGENENAVTHFKNAIAADPELCAAMNDLGTTYLRMERIDLATEQFERAIAVDPHGARPYYNLAVAYLARNEPVGAERAARRAIDLDRGATHGLLTLGMSLILQGKFTAEAGRVLTRAAGDFKLAKFWHAIWLVGTGEIANAKVQLRTYISNEEGPAVKTATAILQRLESER